MSSQISHEMTKVAVLMGGWSREREVSLMSGRGVLGALQNVGVDVFAFDPSTQSLEDLVKANSSHAFIALHGKGGEDGSIQGALECLDIAYTGSGILASALAMNKALTKTLWELHGIPTPKWQTVDNEKEAQQVCRTIGLPLMLKAAHEGSTLGIQKVSHPTEVLEAFHAVRHFDALVIAEQFISGDEITSTVIDEGDGQRALPLVKIVAPDQNYDFEHKYFSNATQYLCPAPLPELLTQKIQQLACHAYQVIGCRGWARVDLMLDADHNPYLIEINTVPGMTGHSLAPIAAKAEGMTYADLCLNILRFASNDRRRAKLDAIQQQAGGGV